jgi:hypothetical protein
VAFCWISIYLSIALLIALQVSSMMARGSAGSPGSYGVRTIDQRLPFQCSASVLSGGADCCVPLRPTAQHAAGDRQNTALSSANVAPAGFGLLTFTQREPRHCSISVEAFSAPAAKHLIDVAQDTPDSVEVVPTGRGAVGVPDHFLPFHRPASAVG